MYSGGYMGTQMMPLVETSNSIAYPTGPDCQFLSGEGLYVLKDEVLLATPPPHPSEAPVQNPNPLATTPLPATAGTKLTMMAIVDRPRPKALEQLLANANAEKAAAEAAAAAAAEPPASSGSQFATLKEQIDGEGAGGSSAATDSTTGRLSFNTPSATSGGSDIALASPTTPAHAQPSTAAASTKPSGPYNPLLAENYVGVVANENKFAGFAGMGGSKTAGTKQRKRPKNSVTKSNSSFVSRGIPHDYLPKRLAERDPTAWYLWGNINRGFQWLDTSDDKIKSEYMTKMLFTKAHCLCHDANNHSKISTHIDMVLGYSTGEVLWYEAISGKYTRLNKNGVIRSTPISEIFWVPGSDNLFMAAYMDGSMVIYDKEREDAPFVFDEDAANRQRLTNSNEARLQIQVQKSIYSTQTKTNPFAFWKISNQRINSFAFAPGDQQHLIAVVSEDGSLRIIDYLKEELVSIFYAYYGGLTCVCWSPDGKYIVTGGQDDLLSIWSVAESTLVARCRGHHSWVTSVAFDPWRCDDRVYRFGSVGEDCRLCLWDFNIGMLIRPKAATTNSSSNIHTTSEAKKQQSGESSGDDTDGFVMVDDTNTSDARVHSVEPRSTTAMLPPVCSKIVDKDPVTGLAFTENAIYTSSKMGKS